LFGFIGNPKTENPSRSVAALAAQGRELVNLITKRNEVVNGSDWSAHKVAIQTAYIDALVINVHPLSNVVNNIRKELPLIYQNNGRASNGKPVHWVNRQVFDLNASNARNHGSVVR
jgi:hypothetical protein